jgi:SAM-dependent methyltransferase
MLKEEAKILKDLLAEYRDKVILNVCSSDKEFWTVHQPFVWEEVMRPLIARGCVIHNLDMKKAEGVDIVNDCTEMVDIKDHTYDIVLFCSGIEHIANVDKALSEIKRVLKKDGIMIASAPGVYPEHHDPIDTLLRLPTRRSWEKILEDDWAIDTFVKTPPMPAAEGYCFNKLVFATIIKAMPKNACALKADVRQHKGITVDAFLLSYKREMHVDKVMQGIRRQSFVRDIYVFHNAPSSKKVRGAINIFADKNFGCISRHAAALLSDCDYAFFIDDDLELWEDLSERFWAAIAEDPESIIGLFGNTIDMRARPEELYGSGYRNRIVLLQRYVDIVVGRCMLVKRSLIPHVYSYEHYYDHPLVDDIMLNLSAQMKTGKPSVMIPSSLMEYRSLDQNHAVCDRDGHYAERCQVIHDFIQRGWRSLLTQAHYAAHNAECEQKEKMVRADISTMKTKITEYLNARNIKGAEVLARRCASFDPAEQRVLYNVASQYLINDELDKAYDIYNALRKMILKGDRELIGLCYYKLAEISLKRDDTQSTQKYLQKCLNNYPQHKKARELMNELTFHTGCVDESSLRGA